MRALETTELHALDGSVVRCVHYISIKLLVCMRVCVVFWVFVFFCVFKGCVVAIILTWRDFYDKHLSEERKLQTVTG